MHCLFLFCPNFIQLNLLAAIGGRELSVAVRKMMKKLGANALWSCFSLKGRKGKRALAELRLHRVIISECSIAVIHKIFMVMNSLRILVFCFLSSSDINHRL